MSDARIEPEWAMATIAFVDIRSFTTFADQATAREAVAYLTEFFEVVLPILREHGAGVIKLLGDGTMAVFGAPERLPDHADRALTAGVAVIRAVDAALGDRCRIGIGVNSGLVLVGTMGAGDVSGLEVVGDPVNVASRVQDATRDMHEPLLLTQATRLLLDDEGAGLVPRGELALRGKARPVAVFGLSADLVTIPGRPGRTTGLR
jgi:class 3 adenylate cyclase